MTFGSKEGINELLLVHHPPLIFMLKISTNELLLFTLTFMIASTIQKVSLRNTKQMDDKSTKYER